MPDYRRASVPGGTYFFTQVTDQRRELFSSHRARRILGTGLRDCRSRWPFTVTAIVLLPEHLHAIWTLPPGDAEYALRWAWLKKEFTKRWLAAGGSEREVTAGRRRERRRGVWQPRFWEHTLEEEADFERHFDYLHYNPVKHGHVRCPHEWPHSRFHRWVHSGVYPRHWACGEQSGVGMDFHDLEGRTGE